MPLQVTVLPVNNIMHLHSVGAHSNLLFDAFQKIEMRRRIFFIHGFKMCL